MMSAGKKKGGGFLSRQVKAKDKHNDLDYLSEEELLKKDSICPEDVLRLPKISESKLRF